MITNLPVMLSFATTQIPRSENVSPCTRYFHSSIAASFCRSAMFPVRMQRSTSYRKSVVFHLFGGMKRHDILSQTNCVSHPFQCPNIHSQASSFKEGKNQSSTRSPYPTVSCFSATTALCGSFSGILLFPLNRPIKHPADISMKSEW